MEGLEKEEENKFLCTISKGLEMEQKVGNQSLNSNSSSASNEGPF
jgi:hypothetical protein